MNDIILELPGPLVFVNSMSDLFHEDVPFSFQLLTKRADRLAELAGNLEWVYSLKSECENQQVMFYFKQWGGESRTCFARTDLG